MRLLVVCALVERHAHAAFLLGLRVLVTSTLTFGVILTSRVIRFPEAILETECLFLLIILLLGGLELTLPPNHVPRDYWLETVVEETIMEELLVRRHVSGKIVHEDAVLDIVRVLQVFCVADWVMAVLVGGRKAASLNLCLLVPDVRPELVRHSEEAALVQTVVLIDEVWRAAASHGQTLVNVSLISHILRISSWTMKLGNNGPSFDDQLFTTLIFEQILNLSLRNILLERLAQILGIVFLVLNQIFLFRVIFILIRLVRIQEAFKCVFCWLLTAFGEL